MKEAEDANNGNLGLYQESNIHPNQVQMPKMVPNFNATSRYLSGVDNLYNIRMEQAINEGELAAKMYVNYSAQIEQIQKGITTHLYSILRPFLKLRFTELEMENIRLYILQNSKWLISIPFLTPFIL